MAIYPDLGDFADDDEFSAKDYLNALAAQIRAESGADLGVINMDGHSTDRAVLAQTLNSLSLFSPARLVILEGALDTLHGKEDAAWLAETLKQLPQNTRLARRVASASAVLSPLRRSRLNQTRTLSSTDFPFVTPGVGDKIRGSWHASI